MNEDYCEQNSCYDSNSFGFDQFQLPQYTVNHPIFNAQNKLMEQMTSVCDMEALDKILEELKEIKRDQRKKIEDMSIEEMRHEQQLVNYEIKDITNDLGYKRFRGEKIDEEYERDSARRRMLSIHFVDEDDYIPLGDIIARYSTSKTITPDLLIEEPDNSLNMGDEHLDTTSSNENLVPILSEFKGISNDTCDVLTCENNRVNIESDLVESLINRDTSIVHSSKIDPILEEFAGELAHIAPNPPGIVEADFDPNDVTSSDDDSFKNIVYIDASPSYIEYDNFKEIEPDQEMLISINNSNNTLLELPEFESFHFNPSFPRPPPEPSDVEKCFEPEAGILITKVFKGVSKPHDFMADILPTLPTLVSDLTFISSFFSFKSEDTIFDPDIVTFLEPMAFSMAVSCSKYCSP
ncbi:hypothetical protein Tco_0922281 [Tanacetum coccineum]|uniref:Reverse transcriptase domain-containing protein n=1 Tax=Tanacetum coccineum TaxID=301880 RepID=A0ABQ5D0E5_9ASTR